MKKILLALLVIGQIAYAQDQKTKDTTKTEELETVFITANRTATLRKTTPIAISKITAKTINETKATTAYEIINKAIKNKLGAASLGLIVCLSAPSIMAAVGWDDHDRSKRYFSVDSAKNLLNSCAENAILFTAGDNDTYSLWIAQEGMNYRKDVTVINTSMIQMDEYRSKLFAEKGISPLKWEPESMPEHAIFQHIFSNTANIPVHVSTSASGQFNDSIIMDHLYLTGLTYIYSDQSLDNLSTLKRNFEKKFLLDHLTRTFSYSFGDLDSRIKYMYVPGLIKLYQHAKASEDLEGISNYSKLLQSIGTELHVESEIQKAMKE